MKLTVEGGELLFQLCEPAVGPGVFGGENRKADHDEQNALQDRQKQPGDAQHQKDPSDDLNNDGLHDVCFFPGPRLC